MLELTGVAALFDLVGWLYWAVAIGALAAAIRYPETTRRRVAWLVVGFSIQPMFSRVRAFLRRNYAESAWAHFKKRCAENAGQKIYSVHHGVKSVLVAKMLPPATDRDLRAQYWMGDPYSNAMPLPYRGILVSELLIGAKPNAKSPTGSEVGFDFVDVLPWGTEAGGFERVVRIDKGRGPAPYPIDHPESRVALSWEDICSKMIGGTG